MKIIRDLYFLALDVATKESFHLNDGISGIILTEVQHLSPGGILDLNLIICAPRLRFFTRNSCLCIEY